MADEYRNTVSGLVRKRHELMAEMQLLRERMAAIANDLESLSRVLQTFGHDAPQVEQPFAHGRMVMFYKNELQIYVLQELQRSPAPASTRELAQRMLAKEGHDGFDRRLLLDLIKRLGKALQVGKRKGIVVGGRAKDGRYVRHLAKIS